MSLVWLLLAFQAGAPPVIGEKPVVLFFVRTDCPIANRYAPEFERLYREYGGKGIDFRLVYVERDLTAKQIETHRREFSYTIPGITDPDGAYVRLAHAHTTPEAAIFVHGKLVYHGRIDDTYVDIGKTRPAPTQHDVADVLADIVAGRTVHFRETKPIGCSIGDLQ